MTYALWILHVLFLCTDKKKLTNKLPLQAEVNEKQRFEEKKKQEGLRKHANISQHRMEIWVKNDGTSSQSKVDDNYDEDLSKLDTVQVSA